MKSAVFVEFSSMERVLRASILVMTALYVCLDYPLGILYLLIARVVIGKCGHSFHMVRHDRVLVPYL